MDFMKQEVNKYVTQYLQVQVYFLYRIYMF